jgi:nicotinamidase-related amidase
LPIARPSQDALFRLYAAGNERLAKSRRRSVILCGLETHVCVVQTALDLAENGFQVLVPQTPSSSRYESDKRIGLERMKSVGAVPCSTEMVVF